MNLLQSIPEKTYGPVLVTLNPPFPPAPELTIGSWPYEHPLYSEKVRCSRTPLANSSLIVSHDAQSVQSQKRLSSIQNVRGITYAGAWTNYGFHEDGFTSGLRVAVDHLGASCPFDIRDAERDVHATPAWTKTLINGLEVARKLLQAWVLFWLVVALRVLRPVAEVIPLRMRLVQTDKTD